MFSDTPTCHPLSHCVRGLHGAPVGQDQPPESRRTGAEPAPQTGGQEEIREIKTAAQLAAVNPIFIC